MWLAPSQVTRVAGRLEGLRQQADRKSVVIEVHHTALCQGPVGGTTPGLCPVRALIGFAGRQQGDAADACVELRAAVGIRRHHPAILHGFGMTGDLLFDHRAEADVFTAQVGEGEESVRLLEVHQEAARAGDQPVQFGQFFRAILPDCGPRFAAALDDVAIEAQHVVADGFSRADRPQAFGLGLERAEEKINGVALGDGRPCRAFALAPCIGQAGLVAKCLAQLGADGLHGRDVLGQRLGQLAVEGVAPGQECRRRPEDLEAMHAPAARVDADFALQPAQRCLVRLLPQLALGGADPLHQRAVVPLAGQLEHDAQACLGLRPGPFRCAGQAGRQQQSQPEQYDLLHGLHAAKVQQLYAIRR